MRTRNIGLATAALSAPIALAQDGTCGTLDIVDPPQQLLVIPAHERPIGGGFAPMDSWPMVKVPCGGQMITGFRWIAYDSDDESWTGAADFAVWPAATVEQGCANENTAVLVSYDIPNERTPMNYKGIPLWEYTLHVEPFTAPKGEFYFSIRNNVLPYPHGSGVVIGPPATEAYSEGWYEDKWEVYDYDGDGFFEPMTCAIPMTEAYPVLKNIFHEPRTLTMQVMTAGACAADCDANGVLDVLDFVCFQSHWAAQMPDADCNGDGTFDILDFVCFQTAFAAGCG
jgi:hypothetical protein